MTSDTLGYRSRENASKCSKRFQGFHKLVCPTTTLCKLFSVAQVTSFTKT